MADYMVHSPVAFLIFNRPDTTKKVFAAIAKAKPRQLLVVADGPRSGRQGEAEKCAAAREVIKKIDWDCEVSTNYSETNLGCKRCVSQGLNWVFDTVDRAIVLEDDVLPDSTFFRYCDELLDRYENDQRVGGIGGCNFQNGIRRTPYSYYFSRCVHIWGWASWARAWKYYDVEMTLWPLVRDGRYLNGLSPNVHSFYYWQAILQEVHQGKIDTWDYQWAFSCWVNNMLFVLPAANLITNIGFGPGATHTSGSSRFSNLSTQPVDFPLVHPPFVMRDSEADSFSDVQWGISSKCGNQPNELTRIWSTARLYSLVLKLRAAINLAKDGKWEAIRNKVKKHCQRI